MQLNELGFRGWNSLTGSPHWRWLCIAQTGIKLAWANRWLRRVMLFVWMPSLALAAGFFAYEQGVQNEEVLKGLVLASGMTSLEPGLAEGVLESPEDARRDVWAYLLLTFFRRPQGLALVLVVGFIAPRLIAQDVQSRAFLLYFSRPITPWQYIAGKAAILWTYLALITTLPALILYLLGILMSPTLTVITDTWDLPFRILAASVVMMAPTTLLALAFSSLTIESRFAGFAWFTVWVIGWVAYSALSGADMAAEMQRTDWSQVNEIEARPWEQPGGFQGGGGRRGGNLRWQNRLQRQQVRDRVTQSLLGENRWACLSLYHSVGEVQAWIFGLKSEMTRTVKICLGVLIGVTLLSLRILIKRVTKPLKA